VHVDAVGRRIVIYFLGLEDVATQVSRVVISRNGIDFEAQPEILGPSYLRVFPHHDMTYGLVMPGQFFRSRDGLHGFEPGPVKGRMVIRAVTKTSPVFDQAAKDNLYRAELVSIASSRRCVS
jgi:hypothetical protein